VTTIGPVQLVVLGFRHPDFHDGIIAQLERLRRGETIRVIDALAVYKDATGDIEVEHLSDLSVDEAIARGSTVAELVGLRIEEDGAHPGRPGAGPGADVGLITEEQAWDVIADVPNDSAAALILLEHRWAVPLRDAIERAGGFLVNDGFVSPFDLLQIGLLTAEDAVRLHDLEHPRGEAVKGVDDVRYP